MSREDWLIPWNRISLYAAAGTIVLTAILVWRHI